MLLSGFDFRIFYIVKIEILPGQQNNAAKLTRKEVITMIEYVLKPNELMTGEPNKYLAQIVNSRSYTFDDIANRLIRL